MVENHTRVMIETDDFEEITLDTGCYGFGNWYWGLHEAVGDMYALIFPIASSTGNEAYEAVGHYVDVSSGDDGDHEANCDDCEYAQYAIDSLIDQLNEKLGEGFIFHYVEGELFLSAVCDEDETDDCQIGGCARHEFQ